MKKPKDVIAIYDAPEYGDRYTVVLDPSWEANPGYHLMLGMNEYPTSPNMGISQFTEGINGSHLGKLIEFESLPDDLQEHIIGRIEE